MTNLVIGKRGFLSSSLKNNRLLGDDFIFSSLEDIKEINIPINKVVILSFNPKWKNTTGYDCAVEIEVLRKFGPEDVLIQYLSTSKVYQNSFTNITEDYETCPSSPYSENKLIAENFIARNFKYFHIFRASNVFNKYGGAPLTFLDIFLENLKNKLINFDVSLDSERDFITTDFVAQVLKAKNISDSGVFNLSSSIPIKISQIIDTIASSNSIKMEGLDINYGEDSVRQVLSNDKLLKSFKLIGLTKSILLKEFGEIYAK